MLETLFVMSTSLCVDEDLPLSYQFGYFDRLSSSDSTIDEDVMVVLRSKMELSYTSSILPLGFLGSHFSLSCVARVFDALESSSKSTFLAKVRDPSIFDPNPNSSSAIITSHLLPSLSGMLLAGLKESILSGDVDGLRVLISSTTSVLNRVDCSSVPLKLCESWNRLGCGRLEGTCGECKKGYVGILGPSNTPCVDENIEKITQPSSLVQIVVWVCADRM